MSELWISAFRRVEKIRLETMWANYKRQDQRKLLDRLWRVNPSICEQYFKTKEFKQFQLKDSAVGRTAPPYEK